jgi:hypothetical protein
MSEPIPDAAAGGIPDLAAAARTCTTPGCGTADAYLDTSTQRTAAWVHVRGGAAPAGDAGHWYHAAACAAQALDASDVTGARFHLVAELTAALAELDAADLDPIERLGRRRGLETALRLVAGRPDPGVARCYLCGCTEDSACAGGCCWVPDPEGMRDVCSTCAPLDTCSTAGCGTTADLDPSDPQTWGWIRVKVAGAVPAPVWVCTPLCAQQAIDRAEQDLAAAADSADEPEAVPA